MSTSKICRFCLYEEKNDTNNQITDVFECTLDILYEKISNCTGICLSPEDPIPALICKRCIDFINQITNFIETIQNSEKVLQRLYGQKYPKSEMDKGVDLDTEEFVSCYSDSNSATTVNDFDITTENLKTTIPTSKEEGDTLFFTGGKKLSIYEMDKSMKSQMGENTYTCDICSKIFNSFFEYQDHQHSHNGHFDLDCSECKQSFSRKDLDEHGANHKVSCKTSNQVLTRSSDTHLKNKTSIHKQVQSRCTEFDSRHTSKASIRNFKAPQSDVKEYICYICGEQNSCQSSMKRHIVSHFSDRPHQCKTCNFSAKSRTDLKLHESKKHRNHKCVCEVCNKIFKSKLSLLQHKKRCRRPKKRQYHVSEGYNLNHRVLKKNYKQKINERGQCDGEFVKMMHGCGRRQECVDCSHCKRQFHHEQQQSFNSHKVSANEDSNVKNVLSMPNTSIELNKD